MDWLWSETFCIWWSAMNPCLPDWNFEYDLPLTNQKKNIGSDPELVELLWQNGQVVMHSQNHRKLSSNQHESSQLQKHDQPIMRGGGSYGNSSNLIQDDEAVSWIHYPVEDSFEKEFCLNFFNELPVPHPMEIDKAVRQVEAEKIVKLGSSDDVLNTSNQQSTIKGTLVPEISGNQMPPPRVQFAKSTQQNNVSGNLGKVVNFSQFAVPVKGDPRPSSLHFGGDARECSVMTVGSSHCGSNQIVNDPDFSRASSNAAGTAGFSAGTFKEDVHKSVVSQSEGRKTETLEPTLTSSSGGSDSSFGGTLKESAGASSHKRKGRDNEESECQSEAAEPEAASGKKPATRSGSTRRSRAAEVHNLSERRRRDRINKKMKALQELIPHCNKTDKASMLDEAIEYLKSLQLQLQIMWMGGGMAPMMFPGVQHYMSSMGMTMCPPPLPTVSNNMHLPQVPVVDQSIPMAPNPNQSVICHTPVLNPMNFQNQMQNPSFPEQFGRYMGIHHMQAASQPMNMFKFSPQTVQQIQTNTLPGNNNGQYSGGAANDALSGKMG
ncbi:hypothetical protein NL676_017230 [Syzygium grande]|nr:hypothetical protein NL676_017230 [Syzygium grande]